MGYRSEVYLGIDKEIVNKLLDYTATRKACFELLFEDSEYAKRTKAGDIHFLWECVKWYDSYDAISDLHSFLEENDDHYKFLRLGEQADDLEELGYSETFYFQVERQVSVCIE